VSKVQGACWRRSGEQAEALSQQKGVHAEVLGQQKGCAGRGADPIF